MANDKTHEVWADVVIVVIFIVVISGLVGAALHFERATRPPQKPVPCVEAPQ
jgi:hypothetical protein